MFNPAKASSNIKEEFIDYIATTHAFANPSLQEQFVKELHANIARGPLGSDSSVDDDIITFAENLCGVNFDKKYIIRAEREPYVPNATIKKYPDELYKKLADSENFVWQVLNDYGFNVDKATDEKELLMTCSIENWQSNF